MGLTEFQKKKAINLFENIYDTNRDGVVEKVDFDEALEKIGKVHHWGKNDGAYKEAQATLLKIWDSLRALADVNNDGMIQKEEWCKMWGNCIDDVAAGKGFPAWQQDYMEFMFYANDTSGDGFIDEEEYAQVFQLFGFTNDEVKICFAKISEGCANNMLSKDDFQKLWQEYFIADDESAKGNFLFGRQKH